MILSIESSCDDSSIAITCIKTLELIYHKKISQEKEHSVYGGVVPELASRLHVKTLPDILLLCKEYFPSLKAIAVTTEPGLSISLAQGIMMAKALSLSLNIPLININHLKGHIYSLFIEKEEIFPMCILLVSGGHTQIIQATSYKKTKIIASTLDDSLGESFDKVAKMLGLSYPGGPIVEQYATKGDENRFSLPLPLKQSPKIAFSYSGLKNAIRLKIEKLKQEKEFLNKKDKEDICASFQKVAIEHILQKVTKLFKLNSPINFAIVGGASANIKLRNKINDLCIKHNTNLYLSKLEYCSDNAAMIGRLAIEHYNNRNFS